MDDQVLADYIRKQAQRHARQVDDALSALTVREMKLVKEAAVMGFVQGRVSQQGETVPKDSVIVYQVIGACLHNPDIYPTIAGRKETDGQEPDLP